MILVVGATGNFGKRLVPMLLAKGHAVRAMTRAPERAEPLKRLGAVVVKGDVRDPASLARACEGVTQVVAAAHGFTPGDKDNNPHTVDDLGNHRLIDAAKAAGATYMLFTSVIGVSPASPLEFFRIKYAVEQYLKASGMDYTILRPTPFMEFWGAMVGDPILKTGKTTIFGGGKNPISFVSAEDVARFGVIALEDSTARNRTIDVGGPEELTLNQVAEIYERISGRQAAKSHVPLPMMRVMRVVMRPFNPMLSFQITGGILMDTEDQTCDMSLTLREYPMKLKRLEDVALEQSSGQQLVTLQPAT